MDQHHYGTHFVCQIAQIQFFEDLNDTNIVANFLVDVVDRIGMRILTGPLMGQVDGPDDISGVSGVVILIESHAAIHTYPGIRSAFLDVFSCRDFKRSYIYGTIQEYFGNYQLTEEKMYPRGTHWTRQIQKAMDTWNHQRLTT